MMLTTFIVVFSCLLTHVFGHSVFINNKENKDEHKLYMGPIRNYVTVYLIDNEFHKGTWILENIDELEEYDLKPRNLVEGKDGKINEGQYVKYNKTSEAGGYVKFEFFKDRKVLEEYPKLKFVYQNEFDEYDGAMVTVDVVQNPELHYDDNIKITKIEDHPKNSVDVKINNKEDFVLYLTNNLYSGYNWYLENAKEIEENPYIELLSTYSSPGNYEFTFRAKNLPNNTFIPTLVFSEKKYEKSEKESANRIYNVNINLKNDYLIEFENDKKEELKQQSVTLHKKENFVVALNVTSTEYKWFLEDVESLDNNIEPLTLGENGEGQFFTYENEETNIVGTYKFKFQVKETIPSNYLTSLKFFEAKSRSDEILSTAEVLIKTKKDRTEEEINNLPFKEIKADGKNKEVIVESNVLLLIETIDNGSTGERYKIANLDEIERSDFIDYVKETYYSDCRPGIVGCGGSSTYIFRIWEVSENDTLPKIKLYNPNFKNRDYEITVKAKSPSEILTCFEDYKCCSSTNDKIYYADINAYWGIENGDWCVINKKRQTKTIKNCQCETKLDYPCCQPNSPVIYTDIEAEWGIEDNQWCVIPHNCDSKIYPVCQETTEVTYIDTGKWGIEFGQWCVMN